MALSQGDMTQDRNISSSMLEQLLQLSPEYLSQDNSRRLIDTTIAILVVTTVVFTLFVISRLIHHAKDPWDVWILLPFSYLCILGLAVLGILVVNIGGRGRHIQYHMLRNPVPNPKVIVRGLQLQTAIEFIYGVSVTVSKLTILILYLKVFVGPIVRRLTWAIMVIVILQWLSFGVVVWASICQPFTFRWDKSVKGHCANSMASYRYFSVPNIVTDLGILLLPISTIWNLRVTRLQKFGLFFTFFTGGLGIVASIIRFVGLFTINLQTDPTYNGVISIILTVAEAAAYFICSCLPYIRPLAHSVYSRCGIAALFAQPKHANAIYSSDRSSKSTFPATAHAKSGYVAIATSSGPSAIDGDRAGFIELVETVEVS